MNLKFLKRFLAITALASMMLGLVACVGSSKTKEGDSDGNKTAQEKEKSPYEDLKIGVLLIGSESDTSGYSFAHAQGIKDAVKSLNMSEDQIVWKNMIPDTMNKESDAQVLAAAEECINSGCQLIFTTSYGYKNATKSLAEKYDNIYFAHATGDLSNGTNFINYFGRIYQARYLSGIAAALKTNSNKIGYVSAWGTENSECTSGINAFAMGVGAVNPYAKIYVRKTNSWEDAEKEKAAAEWLLNAGCDVIAQHVNTPEPQLAAQAYGAYGIGYNSDMSLDAPKAVLCSVIWNWDVFYKWAIQSVAIKSWDGKNYFGGLNEGIVGLTNLAPINNPITDSKIEDAANKMKSGDWDVFTGLIRTNMGATMGSDGTSLDDKTILYGMNWYYHNVVSTN